MADTIVTVRATLPYALRHPDCTPTSQEALMRMAANRIEELEQALDVKNELMKSNLGAANGLIQKYHDLEERTDNLHLPLRRWVEIQSDHNAAALYSAALDYLGIQAVPADQD